MKFTYWKCLIYRLNFALLQLSHSWILYEFCYLLCLCGYSRVGQSKFLNDLLDFDSVILFILDLNRRFVASGCMEFANVYW